MRVVFALIVLAASLVSVSSQGYTGPNFYITGGNGQNYTFAIDGVDVFDPSFTLTVGTTYKFFINKTMNNHPFGFSVDTITMSNLTGAAQGGVTTSGSCTAGQDNNPLSWITSDTTNPCIISITPPATEVGKSIYYRCSVHSAMVGTLTPAAAGGSGTTSTPTTPSTSNGTTSTPTTTTAPTTTPKPTGSSSTGKNSAAIIVPGAVAAVICAAINALFSA